MDQIVIFFTELNTFIWSTKFLIPILILVSLYFTIRTRAVQFRLLKNMITSIFSNSTSTNENSISSKQAFMIGLASRIGTGNLAGVAMALVLGGPGAIFWMWFVAIFASVNAFIESTLAQLYKIRDDEVGYRGGPAYYMKHGLNQKILAYIFAIILVTFYAFTIIGLLANTISSSLSNEVLRVLPMLDLKVATYVIAILVTILTAYIIFGGAKRIVNYSTLIVALMSIVFISMATFVVFTNIHALPSIFKLIFTSAFNPQSVAGGTIGGIISIGFKRGLFSNEAGMGTAPNAAASADVKHPVVQGGIQALGVFVDTLIICSGTAFIILFSGIPLTGTNGINLTQAALLSSMGGISTIILTICIFFFAFSSILGIYFYAQTNYEFLFPSKKGLNFYKLIIVIAVFFGSVVNAEFIWMLGDLSTGLIATINLIAIIPLYNDFAIVLKDYEQQLKFGIKEPIFNSKKYPKFEHLDIWHQ